MTENEIAIDFQIIFLTARKLRAMRKTGELFKPEKGA